MSTPLLQLTTVTQVHDTNTCRGPQKGPPVLTQTKYLRGLSVFFSYLQYHRKNRPQSTLRRWPPTTENGWQWEEIPSFPTVRPVCGSAQSQNPIDSTPHFLSYLPVRGPRQSNSGLYCLKRWRHSPNPFSSESVWRSLKAEPTENKDL